VLSSTTAGARSWIGAATTSAASLTSGTLADARLSANVPLLGAANTFSAKQTFAAGIVATTCKAVRSAAQSIADSSLVAISYTAANAWGSSSMHSTSVNPSHVVAPLAGYYDVSAFVGFAGAAAGIRQVYFRKNGDVYGNSLIFPSNGASAEVQIVIVETWSLAANDYIEILVWQNSGGALSVTGSNVTLSLTGVA
jgi:hypothetical protein